MYVTGSSVTGPVLGLGAQAMAGGSFKTPFLWCPGRPEFAGMNIEGSVKLGYRKEPAALEDADERKALYDKVVAEMYEKGKRSAWRPISSLTT